MSDHQTYRIKEFDMINKFDNSFENKTCELNN